VIRGTVSNLFYWNFKHNAALSLDAQRVALERGPVPIAIVTGDQLVVVGFKQQDVFKATFYFDETNGE
jgi:hypothetical protein